MNEVLQQKLDKVHAVQKEAGKYHYAARILNFDQQTLCPEKAQEEQGEIAAFLNNKAFQLEKDPAYIEAFESLYEHRKELSEKDAVMAESLHRSYAATKNITPKMNEAFSLVYNKAYVDWLRAKTASDFSIFAPTLKELFTVIQKELSLKEDPLPLPYDNLLDNYERGMTTKDLDQIFDACKKRLLPLLERIKTSQKKIRTDFMHKKVTNAQQEEMARYLMDLVGYDTTRGALATTEHPFTDWMSKNDVRITTHYHENDFSSSIYTIIHESGHAMFEQFQPEEDHDFHITGCKTMGMHESVSRFYENIIGRSPAFIHTIYPKVCEIFPEVMEGVSEKEFWEAMNLVQPSLIRTQADEFTYVLHIIIRYELEKALWAGEIGIDDLNTLWADKYEEYLGIRPTKDAEGALQDVHWSFGFGYFPTYAIGNFYNAMYYQEMKKALPVEDLLSKGELLPIRDWMQEHVFKKANLLTPKEWIKDITGKALSPDAYLDYLEAKYKALYELD